MRSRLLVLSIAACLGGHRPAGSLAHEAVPGQARSATYAPGNTTDAKSADRDGDGIPDSEDMCPDEPEDRDGYDDSDGCPDPDCDDCGPLRSYFVPFRRNESTLAPVTLPALDRLAAELSPSPGVLSVEIIGNTAYAESPKLATARATAVQKHLISRGLAPARLTVVQGAQKGRAEVRFRRRWPPRRQAAERPHLSGGKGCMGRRRRSTTSIH